MAFGFRRIAAIIAGAPVHPFVKIGENKAYNYIAIRADEDRVGYKLLKNVEARNIEPKYPFKEDGITERDVYRIDEGYT